MSTGLILPAAALAFGSINFKPKRGFQPFKKNGDPDILITAQVTVEERHHDELEITDHPIEQGASISDHAYKRPAEVWIECAWSNSPSRDTGIIGTAVGVATALTGQAGALAAAAIPTVTAIGSILSGNDVNQVNDIYQKLLKLQASREPFDVYTGKRVYNNMLFKALDVVTNVTSENALMIRCICRQLIIVKTQTVVVPINTNAQAQPQKTTPTTNKGQTQLQVR